MKSRNSTGEAKLHDELFKRSLHDSSCRPPGTQYIARPYASGPKAQALRASAEKRPSGRPLRGRHIRHPSVDDKGDFAAGTSRMSAGDSKHRGTKRKRICGILAGCESALFQRVNSLREKPARESDLRGRSGRRYGPRFAKQLGDWALSSLRTRGESVRPKGSGGARKGSN